MITCACAALLRGREILLGRRSPDRPFYPGVWDLIGGHCEGRESPLQTLLRELGEELGVHPTEYELIDILDEPNLEVHGAHEYHVFAVTAWDGEPRNLRPLEHSDIQWFSVEDAVGLELADPRYPALLRQMVQSGRPRRQPETLRATD